MWLSSSEDNSWPGTQLRTVGHWPPIHSPEGGNIASVLRQQTVASTTRAQSSQFPSTVLLKPSPTHLELLE